MMFDEVIPPKIPSTAETFGNTIDKKHVAAVKPAQIITLALSVNSFLPVTN
jgi:hypothetical protein